MRVVAVNKSPLGLFAILLLCSCGPKVPISSIHREDITSVTLEDCASRKCSLDSTKLIDEFWQAVSTSREANIDNLRDHTGYARVWIQRRNGIGDLYFEVVASNKYGPVIDNQGERRICDKCEEFFTGLKSLHPEFNWCQAPKIH